MDAVEGLPPELLRFLVYLLSGGFIVTGSALIGVLIFMAKGVLGRLRSIEGAANDQFRTFGQQLSSVRDMITQDLHKHDVRITRLEEWRRTRDGDD
ncbi:MAG: hypothetical protein IT516_12495 [Burkholderiales bacterium]|nr:hypothetical protein [Burkholderiales bacterium]